MNTEDKSIYQFNVKTLSGKEVSLGDYANKVILVVNTASKCGFTPQLAQLEQLYATYKDKGFEVLAFPSNEFGEQEPLEGEKIEQFCQRNYGVTFPVFEKTEVKGKNASPLFQFLADKRKNGKVSSVPKWNFHKYLIDKSGKVVDYFYTITTPTSGKVTKAIEKLLSE